MSKNVLSSLVYQLSQFSQAEQDLAIERINELLKDCFINRSSRSSLVTLRSEELAKEELTCFHCGSDQLVGNGYTQRKAKRYVCRSCNKSFCETTSSVISGIRDLDAFNHYISCLLKGYSLRRCAQEVGISFPTSFDWRHKILKALDRVSKQPLENMVEVDETFFLFSEKGSKLIKERRPRKRGGKASQDGMNKQHVNVRVATDFFQVRKNFIPALSQTSVLNITSGDLSV